VRPENSILRRQVLVLEEQFLVHQPCYIRQETSPLIAFHGNCPSSQISDSQDVRVFCEYRAYTTYIGDSFSYDVAAIASDGSGNTYATGSRAITRLQTDVFVSKIDSSGLTRNNNEREAIS
jgi:hypothetical protein